MKKSGVVSLSIKEVPEEWAEALKVRANANHRSLQGELLALVESAANQWVGRLTPSRYQPTKQEPIAVVLERLKKIEVPLGARQLSSVGLIRQDRDRR